LHAWRLPIKTEGGSPVFWNPGLSMSDLNVIGGEQSDLWDRFTPVLDIDDIIRLGKDPRSGRKLRGRVMEPDAVLMTWVKAHNMSMPKAAHVPIIEVKTAEGQTYEAVPAQMVMAYQKLFPNIVAYGRLLGRDRADPFGDEQALYRQIREATGQSFLVNNPVKAESDFLRRQQEGPLSGVRPPSAGATTRRID